MQGAVKQALQGAKIPQMIQKTAALIDSRQKPKKIESVLRKILCTAKFVAKLEKFAPIVKKNRVLLEN